MKLEEAIEVVMVSPCTVGCFPCGGRGKQRGNGFTAIHYCRDCNGAGVVINPIWKEAWMIMYPEDVAGMFARVRKACMQAYKERHKPS
jgi:hypothetical protein